MMRHTRLGPIGIRLALALAFSVLASLPASMHALAQSGSAFQTPEIDKRREVRKPTGLPGARGTQNNAVAPAERIPSDMSPNEALFDAVNRGDLSAARDAITRGAQLEGRNILGLTPLELSIDLGRNELTFLLLSMRGAGSAPPPPPSSSSASSATAARPAVPRAAERPTPQRDAAPTAPARQRQTTTAAAGTPVPQAGFLGFGGPMR